jgi:serine O-acetyltransferase
MGIRPKLLRLPFSLIYKMLFPIVELILGIKLSYNVKVGRRLRIDHSGGMVLGARQIGDDCIIRQNTTFGIVNPAQRSGKPTIGNRVDIGTGVVILGDLTIGDDVIIGANAVVTKDIPPRSVAVGVPARVIKTRELTPPAQPPPDEGDQP